MVEVKKFNHCFLKNGVDYFTGVPDSTLKEWLKLIFYSGKFTNRIASNEGAAISNASRYYLATGNIGVVYLQNSGLGNCINPLTSLTDPEVYGIPMIMLIGWRGIPGQKDEPQHKKMGAITKEMLKVLGIPYSILNDDNYIQEINKSVELAKLNKKPYALIISPGFFDKYSDCTRSNNSTRMNREESIRSIVSIVKDNDIILSTTGKTSRELYEVCSDNNRGHSNNFYNVGSMGHVGAIGLEVALQKSKRLTFIFDGDGALIMHMGTLASIGEYQPKNLVHIVFDNESHESTGGQPTLSKAIDIAGVMRSCNYKQVEVVSDKASLIGILNTSISGPLGVVIKITSFSRKNLGRPTSTPEETKTRFMEWIDK